MACVLANVFRNPEKHPQAFVPRDFMPQFGQQAGQGWEDQLQLVELLNAMFGGEDLRDS